MDRLMLRADCSRCFGLCCVVPAFAKSADFAIDKPAGKACPNLGADSRCGIHAHLRERGFPGCTVYDCFGAGQRISVTLGDDWRASKAGSAQMFAAFPVLRDLHELLFYLTEAAALGPDAEVDAAVAEVSALTERAAPELAATDVAEVRRKVNPLLRRASDRARGGGPDKSGADLIGARLKGRDLRRTSLRGAYLIGADLRDADLTLADVTGADLRGADLRGTDLSAVLFLAQPQLDAARGDGRTKIPDGFTRPNHWKT